MLFAPDREVIYVGQVGSGEKKRLFGRLKNHKRDHLRGRWSHFSWFGLKGVGECLGLEDFYPEKYETTGEVLDELEAVLIHLFEPRLNMQRAKWKETQEYFQFVVNDDPRVEEEE